MRRAVLKIMVIYLPCGYRVLIIYEKPNGNYCYFN